MAIHSQLVIVAKFWENEKSCQLLDTFNQLQFRNPKKPVLLVVCKSVMSSDIHNKCSSSDTLPSGRARAQL